MKEKIKKILENGRLAIIIVFLLELLLTIFITPNRHDDAWFLEQVSNRSIFSFEMERYNNWTSRLLLEMAECFTLKVSKYLWILIEALMFTLACYSISRLFIKKEDRAQNNTMLVFMMLLYPLNAMNGSGWATTTTVYMWPLATGLFAIIPIRKIWDGEKIKAWQYPLYSLSLIYSGNQEQTAAILFGVYIVFSILMILKNKKIHPYMIIQNILIIVSLIFIFTCPGNYVRKETETIELFQDFKMLTVLDKISLGFTSAFGIIIEKINLVYAMFSLLITIYIFSRYKNNTYRIISIIPFLTICLLGITTNVTNKIFPFVGELRNYIIEDRMMLTAANCNNLFNIVPLSLALINFTCLGLSLLIIFKNLKNNLALLIYLIGLASKIIIGFSPTVFSSAERTTIFFEFSMIIVMLLIWQELIKGTEKNDKKVQKRTGTLIKFVGSLQYINVLLCILMTQK